MDNNSKYLQLELVWQKTDDSEFPYRTTFNDETLTLRINDFPVEELYTLIVDDKEIYDFSGWPRTWKAPYKPWADEGLSAKERARHAYEIRHDRRMKAKKKINPIDGAKLDARNLKKYGSSDGPTFKQLVEEAKSQGLTGDDIYKFVIKQPPRQSIFGTNENLDIEQRAKIRTAGLKYLQLDLVWQETDDPESPYRTTFNDEVLILRINDFPENQMYMLLVDGKKAYDFTNWPSAWKRPEDS